MNGFKIGFIVSLSFLLVTAVYAGTLGYYPAPEGPKAPEYPDYGSLSPYSQPLNVFNQTQPQQLNLPVQSEYERELEQYQKDLDAYKAEQETFVDREIIPYVRNIIVAWIIIHTLFVLLGILFIRLKSELVGSGFAFSSVWTILFLPLACTMWYVNLMISSFSRQAEQAFSIEPIFQAVMWTSIAGVVVLSIFGSMLYGVFKFPQKQKVIVQQVSNVA